MKFRTPLLTALGSSALLFCTVSFAQNAPMTPATPPASSNTPHQVGSTSMQTPEGELIIHSTMPPAPPAGPAPSFEQLSGGGNSITREQAAAYPLLANDFIYADQNRNNRISRSEYKNWVGQK
jgi:hypothetical protein